MTSTTAAPSSLEGFIASKVFAEGLRRTGKELSRDALIASLEGLRGFDVGGYIVEFGPRKRNGSSSAEPVSRIAVFAVGRNPPAAGQLRS